MDISQRMAETAHLRAAVVGAVGVELTGPLERMGACREAREWCGTQPDLASAWANCRRGDWMLWLAGKACKGGPWSDDRKPVVLAACACARLALKYVPPGESRPLRCIEVTQAWCRGEATKEQVLEVRRNAYAAYAAAYAAYAAADAAAYADAAADALRTKTLKSLAAIVRKRLKIPARLP